MVIYTHISQLHNEPCGFLEGERAIFETVVHRPTQFLHLSLNNLGTTMSLHTHTHTRESVWYGCGSACSDSGSEGGKEGDRMVHGLRFKESYQGIVDLYITMLIIMYESRQRLINKHSTFPGYVTVTSEKLHRHNVLHSSTGN